MWKVFKSDAYDCDNFGVIMNFFSLHPKKKKLIIIILLFIYILTLTATNSLFSILSCLSAKTRVNYIMIPLSFYHCNGVLFYLSYFFYQKKKIFLIQIFFFFNFFSQFPLVWLLDTKN